ncbi:MAG: Yip1 family protein [Chlamydiales bacterium]
MELNQSNQINPWVSIWLHPKKTMGYLLATDPRKYILWLAIIGGILSSIPWINQFWIQYPENKSLIRILVIFITIIIGGLIGIAYLYLGGWLYKLTGSWLGGKGDFIQAKCAVGWANYPFIVASLFALFNLAVIPNPWLQGIMGLLYVILVIWAFIIFMNLLAQAHQFSAWKSLLSFFITLFLVFAALMVIALLTPLISPLFVATIL